MLVVDDSVVIRKLIGTALASHPGVEMVGVAANGSIALQKIPLVEPDALTLDIEMPEMDGLETLRRVKAEYPRLRVVMFSTLTERGGAHTLEALSLGADDYVTKAANGGSLSTSLQRLGEELIPKILQFFPGADRQKPEVKEAPKPTPYPRVLPARGKVDLIAIAISTGGPNALAELFPKFPADLGCPIVVTQHMPPMFTRLLAERLNKYSPLTVEEAKQGSLLEPGKALIAPGAYHLALRRDGVAVKAHLTQGPPENSCRPAADVMLRSAAEVYGARVLSVVMTGMGKDGLAGARALKELGGPVIAQDKASSVVWGMPGFVTEAGLADVVAPLDEIAFEIQRYV